MSELWLIVAYVVGILSGIILWEKINSPTTINSNTIDQKIKVKKSVVDDVKVLNNAMRSGHVLTENEKSMLQVSQKPKRRFLWGVFKKKKPV